MSVGPYARIFGSLKILLAAALQITTAHAQPQFAEMLSPASQGDNNSQFQSYKHRAIYADSVTYFLAFANRYGLGEMEPGLYKTNGTAVGTTLVKTLFSTLFSGCVSTPHRLTAARGQLFFLVKECGNTSKLWRSDGTENGTMSIAQFNISGLVRNMVAVGSNVFFTVDRDLWQSDGTVFGTRVVKYNAIPYYSDDFDIPDGFVAYRDLLYFTNKNTSGLLELWKSNGTSSGTVLVKTLGTTFRLVPLAVSKALDRLVFMAQNGFNYLYFSDGTESGTVAVKRMGSMAYQLDRPPFCEINGQMFFAADANLSGGDIELWKTDGTPDGTLMVKNINPGFNASLPSYLTKVDSLLFFSAKTETTGRELWRSDGTAAGTFLVKDAVPGINGSDPADITSANGLAFYSSNNTMWRSNGEAAQTLPLLSAQPPGTLNGTPDLVSGKHYLFYFDDYGDTGGEPKATDGTELGTISLANINTFQSAGAKSPVTVDNNLYFFWDDIRKLSLDTKTLSTVDNRNVFQSSSMDTLIALNGKVLFRAKTWTTNLKRLFVLDSTGASLLRTADSSNIGEPIALLKAGNRLYFYADDHLYVTDGSNAGTHKLALAQPAEDYRSRIFQRDYAHPTGMFWFEKFDPILGYQLWKTDGSVAGTVPVKVVGGFSAPIGSNIIFDSLYCFASRNGFWKSDGTEAGTVLVKQFSSIGHFFVHKGELYFVATSAQHAGLWKSDGTDSGTVFVKDITPLLSGCYPCMATFASTDSALFFTASDGIHGAELWKTDGTEAGTTMVKDLSPEPNAPAPANLTGVGGLLFFTLSNLKNGNELWVSDGTPWGTLLVQDIIPDVVNGRGIPSNPYGLIAKDSALIFSAVVANRGRTLFRYHLPAPKEYRFVGDGNWSNPSNWSGNMLPPTMLPFLSRIVIDPQPNGVCLINANQFALYGSAILVAPGKKFVIDTNLELK
jgi:ELWxxDGT repeat protein